MDARRIGERLRKLRTDENLTMDDVAASVQISRSTLNMYELGLRIPEDNIKIKLAKYFHTSVEQLFFESS